MRRIVSVYETSVGKKLVMAVTGAVLFLFVFVHMIGNLKIYQGPEKYDAYAAFLREAGSPALGHGQMLWIARIVLLGATGLHVISAVQLAWTSRRARDIGYRRFRDQSFSYASRTMRWGGVIIAAFVVYHLLHLTLGTVHHDFSHESVYRNVVSAFRRWPVSTAYLAAMVPLGLHLYHGMWSVTQTLGAESPGLRRCRRPLAAGVALAVFVGNVSIPLAVLAGWVR